MDPVRALEKLVSLSADKAWPLMQALGKLGAEPPAPSTRSGATTPSPAARRASSRPLGWPRETDSLCPTCVKEARAEILRGDAYVAALLTGKPGEIRARILERDGRIVMEKTCPKHGTIRGRHLDRPARSSRGSRASSAGATCAMTPDTIHDHGSSTIRYGRGAVLTVDLTNRCNMMCDPCFMDANQVGYVHELAWEEIAKILDDAADGEAAAADVDPVLGRRADAVAALPRRHPLREEEGLLRGAVRDERPPLRRGARASPRSARRRACAWRTSSSTA